MRKSIKVVLSTVLAIGLAVSSVACNFGGTTSSTGGTNSSSSSSSSVGGNTASDSSVGGETSVDSSVGGETSADSSVGGGASSKPLKIRVLKKGYGDTYVDELAKAYTLKTGIEVSYKPTGELTQIEAELKAGPSVNDYDLYFHISHLGNILKDGGTYAKGWNGLVFEDLSDVMSTVPVGYQTTETVAEMLNQYAYEGTLYEGKSYGVPYALALEGLLYNESLMVEFFGEDYHTPRTSDEMFEMFDFIAKGGDETKAKGNYKIKGEGRNKYQVFPFAYPGRANYMLYPFIAFWAQQLGQEGYYQLLEGKDLSGEYSAEIFASDERYNAFEVVHDMITVGDLNKVGKAERPLYDGYVSMDNRTYDHTRAQVDFLSGKAVFMTTGDWVEREMEALFPNPTNIKFMRMPVISTIIDFLPDKTITTDAQLQEVVEYVDNGGTKGFGSYSDADVAKVREARLTINCESETHMMVVPAYSDNIEGAKDFIKFVLSKEGQEIQMKYSYGNSVPYSLDYKATYGTIYENLSVLSKSKLDIASNANLVGLLYNKPITYKGGMELVDLTSLTMEGAFGNNTATADYKKPVDYFTTDYNYVVENFQDWLTKAGLK